MNLVRRAEKHLPQSLLLLCASGCGALDAWWGSWARADDERKGCLVATRNGRSPPRSWCKNAGHPMKTVTTINAEDLAAAQRWFARLLAPDCSDAERAWFEHWRDTAPAHLARSEEHTSELQSLMRISYAVFCLKKKKINKNKTIEHN